MDAPSGSLRTSTAIQPRRCAACRSSSARRWKAGVVSRSKPGSTSSRTESRRSRSRARASSPAPERARRRQRPGLRRLGAVPALQQIVGVQRVLDPGQAAQKVRLAVAAGQRVELASWGVPADSARGASVSSRQCRGTSRSAAASAPSGVEAADHDDRRRVVARDRRAPGTPPRPRTRPAPRPADRLDAAFLLATASRTWKFPIYGRLEGRQAGELFSNRPK